MSWYEATTTNSLGQKQDLHYYFQFHDSELKKEKPNALKKKQENTTETEGTQLKDKTKKQKRTATKKQDKPKKKARKTKVTEENFI